jgi:hypothetical protein
MELNINDQYHRDTEFDQTIDEDKTICDIEHDVHRMDLDDSYELCALRRAWVKFANEAKVSDNTVDVSVCQDHCDGSQSNINAGSSTNAMNECETELWSMQDAAVWTVDPDNPTLSQALVLASPQREKWMEALQSEISALHELVDRPVVFNILKGKSDL